MKSTIRKFKVLGMLSLPLAAIALAVLLLSGGFGSNHQAHAAGPNVDMSLSTTNCIVNGTSMGVASCSGGSTFTVSFNVVKFLAGGYDGYDLAVVYAGSVNYKAGSLVQPASVGVSCAGDNPACWYNELAGGDSINSGTPKVGNTGELGNGEMDTFGGHSTGHPLSSTYTGSVATMQFVCKSTGTGTITLKSGSGNTDLAGPGGGTEAADESLTVTCKVAPTATPVPPTATPPAIPRVQKDCNAATNGVQTECNVFLQRQGLKIPPSRCDDGTSFATLTETISGPIASISPKGELQTLAAFEFEVRFDSTKVCVNLIPSAEVTGNVNFICTVQDKDSSTLEGIARIGCVSTGKGHSLVGLTLATIQVRPQPELFSQIRPNQDNGNVVQILNQGCELADEQGHAIPIFSCEDADITFRYLEGDVDGPDCDVDVLDAQQLAFRWGVQKGSLLFNSFMDLEPSGQVKGDGDIDIKDIQFVFGRLGSTCTAPWPAQLPVNPKA